MRGKLGQTVEEEHEGANFKKEVVGGAGGGSFDDGTNDGGVEKDKDGVHKEVGSCQVGQEVEGKNHSDEGGNKHSRCAFNSLPVDFTQTTDFKVNFAKETADDFAKGVTPQERHEGEHKQTFAKVFVDAVGSEQLEHDNAASVSPEVDNDQVETTILPVHYARALKDEAAKVTKVFAGLSRQFQGEDEGQLKHSGLQTHGVAGNGKEESDAEDVDQGVAGTTGNGVHDLNSVVSVVGDEGVDLGFGPVAAGANDHFVVFRGDTKLLYHQPVLEQVEADLLQRPQAKIPGSDAHGFFPRSGVKLAHHLADIGVTKKQGNHSDWDQEAQKALCAIVVPLCQALGGGRIRDDRSNRCLRARGFLLGGGWYILFLGTQAHDCL